MGFFLSWKLMNKKYSLYSHRMMCSPVFLPVKDVIIQNQAINNSVIAQRLCVLSCFVNKARKVVGRTTQNHFFYQNKLLNWWTKSINQDGVCKIKATSGGKVWYNGEIMHHNSFTVGMNMKVSLISSLSVNKSIAVYKMDWTTLWN